MDIQLPIIDGYTATRKIKANPAWRSIPIIAVTSYALSGEELPKRPPMSAFDPKRTLRWSASGLRDDSRYRSPAMRNASVNRFAAASEAHTA